MSTESDLRKKDQHHVLRAQSQKPDAVDQHQTQLSCGVRFVLCTRCVRGAAAGILSEMYETSMNGHSFILVSGRLCIPSASVRVSVITARRTAQPAERSGWRKDWDQCPQPSSPESTGLVRMDVGQYALASQPARYQSATPVALLSD